MKAAIAFRHLFWWGAALLALAAIWVPAARYQLACTMVLFVVVAMVGTTLHVDGWRADGTRRKVNPTVQDVIDPPD